MDEKPDQSSRTILFRTTIATFINERKAAKLKDGDTDSRQAAKYDYNTWLADAARRVSQIQAVTHVLKATHPDARGSSLHVAPDSLTQHAEIGTHVLGEAYADDIVGNAAALDVYKFLKLEVDGQRLLDWLLSNDADLLAALNGDPATAHEWAAAFKGLIRPVASLASHTMAKQLYWSIEDDPTDDANFHLLQPLFPSSLVHAVHQEITSARFGDDNKLARQARRKSEPHHESYRDYRNLVLRKLGGTKPQNISQLNSERGGVNYLLASLPPIWKQTPERSSNLLHIESALKRFQYFEGVPEQLRALCILLESDPKQTLETRDKSKLIEKELARHLTAYGLASRELLEPGWSRHPDCKLPMHERVWLDPDRAHLPVREDHVEDDQAFIREYHQQDWPEQVAQRFGHWLNGILRERNLPVGDVEQTHWAKQALREAELTMPFKAPSKKDPEARHG